MTKNTPRGGRFAGWLGAAVVAGCAAPPVVAPPPPATISAPTVGTASPIKGTAASYVWSDKLGAAAQRLRSGLQGDNVAVSQTTDQRLWVSLPAEAAFAPGRAAVKAPATAWLDKVAAALRDNPAAEVQIVGDSDSTGSEAAGRALAQDRAASARDWMVMRGVLAQRVTVAGRNTRAAAADPRRLDILIGERGRP